MELISRVVGGWNVRICMNGRRYGRFFADTKHGSKTKALSAAKLYRDELLAERDARPRRTPRPLVVIRDNATYLQIRIPKPGGGTRTTEFSTRRHGMREARRLAIEAYDNARAIADSAVPAKSRSRTRS